jgi:type IV pilus assembly protein PilB
MSSHATMPATASTMRLRRMGEVLVEQKVVTQEQLGRALEAQKGSSSRKLLGEVLVELGYCSEFQILEALAAGYDVPFVRLTPQLVDPTVVSAYAREELAAHTAVPMFLVDGVLTIAMVEASNVFFIEELTARTGHAVQVVIAPKGDILAAIETAFRARPADSEAMEQILADAEKSGEMTAEAEAVPFDAESDTADSPVVKLVQQLIVSAVREGVSDIHFEPGERELRVRFRLDGRLYEKMKPPHQLSAALVARLKILSGLNIAERRLPQDGAIRMIVDDRPIDLRISTLPNNFGEKVVMRVLDMRNAQVPLDKLGMNPTLREAFERAVREPHGLILVTGPTGSGKSTTLYSSLNLILSPEINICTAEDPVEYNLRGVNQFQVRDSIGLSFAATLRALLRQDPDVIMVGEIRDAETARIAVQAALTGHLVLSTLHTNDAVGAVSRLTNLGVEPYLVSAAVEAVLAQRLLRRICSECATQVEPPPHVRAALTRLGIKADRIPRGRGCSTCHQIGTRGRVGIYEFLDFSDDVRSAVARGEPEGVVRALALQEGMKTLRQDGLEQARAGVVTYENVLRETSD